MAPGVVLKSKFVMPGSSEFGEYVNYIDRDEAKINQNIKVSGDNEFHVYHSFMDYMGDEDKQGSLFTEGDEKLDDIKKKALKAKFKLAQLKGSPMWQDVISFDNAWLEKQGLYDSKDHTVDEKKMQNVVREAMHAMLHSENMENTATWAASIHYNTDNIHVHVATVEPLPTRKKVNYFDKKQGKYVEEYRAKRKPKTIQLMKSKIANTILDRANERNMIDQLIRESVRLKKESKKETNMSTNKKTKELFLKSIEKLPEDLSQWKYGFQTINEARPFIDEISNIYLETYHKDDIVKLHKLLDDEVQVMKEMYGEDSSYENYKKTKLDDLKKRMGNAVLSEMREFEKNNRASNRNHTVSRKRGAGFYNNSFSRQGNLNYALIRLSNSLRKTYHDYKRERNIEEFDRMMEGHNK